MITGQTHWPSPAKLNLFLYIIGQRESGYHDLQTLFQFVDYGDTLTITATSCDEILLSPGIAGVSVEDNLIYKAAMALKNATGCDFGADIHLKKILYLLM